MKEKLKFSLASFKKNSSENKRKYRGFISRLQKQNPRGIDKVIARLDEEVWKETNCLSCANCCKSMTPTYTMADMKRIASHFKMTVVEFQKKWLRQEKGGDRDWMNKSTPCQFLNKKDNKCEIYAIRPADCAGFPHLKKKFKDYAHVHAGNVDSCPATYNLVEKLHLIASQK